MTPYRFPKSGAESPRSASSGRRSASAGELLSRAGYTVYDAVGVGSLTC